MAKNKKNKNKSKILEFLIPVLVACVVLSGFAVSGHLTKSKDIQNPTASQSVSTTAPTTEKKVENTKVSLVAVGDNLIHSQLVKSGKKDDGSLDYNYFYDNIRTYVQAADIACINQETMLGGSSWEYSGYPLFNSPWEIGEAAINAGFDVFTCATNHSMDKGSAGIEKELEFFSKHNDVTHIGTNATKEDYDKITYLTKNNITFALLNYTYGTNGIPVPEDKPYIVNLLSEKKVKKDIAEARKNADVVIVFPHWGTENSHDISEQQKKYVKIFSDLGVDIVIGTHPHVLQPVEWVENAETGKKMLVYYSIGNFISRQVNLNQMCGGMAEITIEKNNGEISITNAKLAPVIDYYKRVNNGYKFSVYKLSDYTEDIAKTQAQDGATVKYFTDLSKKIVSEEFLNLK